MRSKHRLRFAAALVLGLASCSTAPEQKAKKDAPSAGSRRSSREVFRHPARAYTSSAVEDSDNDLHIGVSAVPAESWSGPGQPVMYLIEVTDRFPDPAWRVVWGDSIATSGYSVFVDASTGQFLKRTF